MREIESRSNRSRAAINCVWGHARESAPHATPYTPTVILAKAWRQRDPGRGVRHGDRIYMRPMCGSLSNLEVGCCARAVPWCVVRFVVLRRPPETARRSRRGPDVRRGTVQCARSVQFSRRVNDGSLISRFLNDEYMTIGPIRVRAPPNWTARFDDRMDRDASPTRPRGRPRAPTLRCSTVCPLQLVSGRLGRGGTNARIRRTRSKPQTSNEDDGRRRGQHACVRLRLEPNRTCVHVESIGIHGSHPLRQVETPLPGSRCNLV